MKATALFLIALSLPRVVSAQEDIPLLVPEERSAVEAQAADFNTAISPALKAAAKSTVRVWSGSRRLSYGTVVGDGSQVLTKWSEVGRATGKLRVDAGGEYRAVKVSGVYQEEDLALLEVEGAPLAPVKWSFEPPKLGSFIAAPQPDGRLAAFGVVSVLERNLRDTDMAFLGVYGDEDYRGVGVRIKDLEEKSGAFAAGLEPGNIILKVAGRSISGLLELRNALTGVKPGATVSMLVERGGKQESVDVVLGNRPADLRGFSGERLRVMERMGGPISEVRDSFSRVVQTDMRPKPNQVGGPVVDLKGNVLGITVARADRTRSFYMPAAAVADLLEKQAVGPELALAREEEAAKAEKQTARARRALPPGAPRPRTEDQMRRHLSDMQRLMDHLREEMETLERP
jgi:serine protease Do